MSFQNQSQIFSLTKLRSMQIIFLAEAKTDLRWFNRYYTRVFPEGKTKADKQYRALLTLLRTQPKVGNSVDDLPGVFEYVITGIPFTALYRLKGETIEIMRIYDQRSGFSNDRKR